MKSPFIATALMGVILWFGSSVVANAETTNSAETTNNVETLMQQRCGGCHSPNDEGKLSRIRDQRKTPEGWLMTLVRMQKVRGAYLTDDERSQLVKHLSDTQGLAPVETADYRYILERRENTPEQWPEADFGEMCARCHSGARVAIQRRSEVEWERLVHFHVGQYPTIEYSYQGRDREWFKIAEERSVPLLAKRYPLESETWNQWKKADHKALDGRWRLVGHQSGHGDYEGFLTVTGGDGDNYDLSFEGQYIDGEKIAGSGAAVIYTGYEWRATITLNDVLQQQVLTVAKDGNAMNGRMFVADEHEKGTDLTLVRVDTAAAQVMGVYPGYIKAGSTAELTLVGTKLQGEVTLPAGLEVIEELERRSDRLRIKVTAAKDVQTQKASLSVGNATASLVVYQKVDTVNVEPAYAVARVGGGQTPKVQGIFEAIGISAGVDGVLGTEDDIRIGSLPATWSVAPFDDVAKHDHDVEFAGEMNAMTGIFTPAGAGPNPKRRFSTNNAGNLSVLATVSDADNQVQGKGQLLVTVQRWNNAPIR